MIRSGLGTVFALALATTSCTSPNLSPQESFKKNCEKKVATLALPSGRPILDSILQVTKTPRITDWKPGVTPILWTAQVSHDGQTTKVGFIEELDGSCTVL